MHALVVENPLVVHEVGELARDLPTLLDGLEAVLGLLLHVLGAEDLCQVVIGQSGQLALKSEGDLVGASIGVRREFRRVNCVLQRLRGPVSLDSLDRVSPGDAIARAGAAVRQEEGIAPLRDGELVAAHDHRGQQLVADEVRRDLIADQLRVQGQVPENAVPR